MFKGNTVDQSLMGRTKDASCEECLCGKISSSMISGADVMCVNDPNSPTCCKAGEGMYVGVTY